MTNFELQTIKNESLEMAPLATLAIEKCQNNLPKLIELKKAVLEDIYGEDY